MESIPIQIERLLNQNRGLAPYTRESSESMVVDIIQENVIKRDTLFSTLQQELETLLGEYSKDSKIFNISAENTEKIDVFKKDYEKLLKTRAEMDGIIANNNISLILKDGIIAKEAVLFSKQPLLEKYKEIVSEISKDFQTTKEVLLKSNKEISDYYSKAQDLLDTVKHLKSKNCDEETITFFIRKMNENIIKLQESKNINELKTEVEKASDKILEIRSIVEHSFCEKNECFCGENPIKIALVPCGHTFCETCLPLTTKKCHMCRSNFTSKMRIYLN